MLLFFSENTAGFVGPHPLSPHDLRTRKTPLNSTRNTPEPTVPRPTIPLGRKPPLHGRSQADTPGDVVAVAPPPFQPRNQTGNPCGFLVCCVVLLFDSFKKTHQISSDISRYHNVPNLVDNGSGDWTAFSYSVSCCHSEKIRDWMHQRMLHNFLICLALVDTDRVKEQTWS